MSENASPVRKPVVERWPTRGMFVAAAVALVCGPALIWRFPSLALQHGGGTFLLAWTVALIVTGLPLITLELALGQRTQRAAPRSFRAMHRRWESVGWAGNLLAFSLACLQLLLAVWALNIAFPALQAAAEGVEVPWRDPVDFAFRQLHGTSGPGGWQFPPVGVVLGLMGVWVLVGLLASAGPRLFGGVIRVFLLIAFGLLLAVIVRQLGFLSAPDSGSINGLVAGLDVHLPRLADLGLWVDAFTHALLACGVGLGAHTALAAYLPKESDVANNGLFVGLASATLTFVCWLGITCALGMLAYAHGRVFHEVGAGHAGLDANGIGMSLLLYPQALVVGDTSGAGAAGQAVWVGFLYIALAGLAITSSVVLLHTCIAALHERLARTRRRLGLAVAGAGLLLTVSLAGINDWVWFDAADTVLVRVGLTVIAILECICLGWIAGTGDLRERINATSERKLGILWGITVRMMTPLLLTFLLVNALMRL